MDITKDDILAMTGDLLESDPAPSVFVKMSDGRLRRMVDWRSLTTRRKRRQEMNESIFEDTVTMLIGALVVTAIIVFVRGCSLKNTPVGCDYTANVVVDKSEKVEYAVSNAVADVESRRFALVGVEVVHDRLTKRWRVSAQGIERAKLLKED